jgi:hypothetical protein
MIDLDRMLAPISDAHPTGDDLRYEGTYDRIREARREDDATLPTGVWQSKLKKADWAHVRDLAADVLATKSKDLQVAVWLTQALVNLDGFAGLTRGLDICGALCRTFWDRLYPRFEGDDLDARILPIVWIKLFPPDRGEYANETAFLTDSDALERARLRLVAAPQSFLCAATDGLEGVSIERRAMAPHAPFFKPLDDYILSARDERQARLDIRAFLASARLEARSDDDKTLLLSGFRREGRAA